jgi:arginase
MKHLETVRRTCEALRDRVVMALGEGSLPVVLGGDHSVAMGTIAGTSQFYRERGEKIGLLWFDAHDDMSTPETSLTGNLHGMPLATALGMGEPSLVNLAGPPPMVEGACASALGLREIGIPQREDIRRSRIGLSTLRHIDEHGVRLVMEQAIRRACNGTAGFHVSFDLDVLDPGLAPGVGTPSAGGLSFTQARMALEMLADTGRLLSVELVELNPILDRQNATAHIGVALLTSLLKARNS